MVADPQHGEPEGAHGPLGAVDACERLGIHRGSVGDARGEAGRGRLVRARHAELAGELAHGGLAGAGVEQRMPDAVLRRRAEAGTPVAGVVGVGARQQHAVAAALGELGEHVVELGLAEVAAVGPVATVAVAGELVRRDRLVGDADRGGDAARALELAGGHRRRDGGHRQRARSERARRDRGHERRVHPARERDDRALMASDAALELGQRASCVLPVRGRERLRPHGLHRRAAASARRARSRRARAPG